jgi:HEXXH motif-containing protein
MAVTNLPPLDTEILGERYERSAVVLIAVARLLARRSPLEGAEGEFLALYARMAASDPAVFTNMWAQPRSYFWTRIAYQLLGACLGGAPLSPMARAYRATLGLATDSDALRWHLDAFKEFCVALALQTGEDWIFATPLRAKLPFTVAGARWSLVGRGEVAIEGVRAGHLVLGGTAEAAAATRRECPVARHAGCELPLHPDAFQLPGLDSAEALRAAGYEYQELHRDVIEAALAAMARHDATTFAHFRDGMRLAALKPRRSGPFTNVSYSELPGACVVSATRHPLAMADRLIHEYHHNVLFALEERGPFFESTRGNPWSDARHYSPWRNDPRPLQGLLHGLFVYLPVARFWLAVHEAGTAARSDLGYVAERLLKIPRQLELAVDVLTREAVFSSLGRALFERLEHETVDLVRRTRAADLPEDVPALRIADDGELVPLTSDADGRALSVCEALLEHVRLRAPADGRAALLARLAADE